MNFVNQKSHHFTSPHESITTGGLHVAETASTVGDARAKSLRRMLDDPDWRLSEESSRRGRELLAELVGFGADRAQLSPGSKAAAVELAWAEFDGELQDYDDYCRFCTGRGVRGSADERRSAWESACLVEASEMLLRQEIRDRGYARPTRISQRFRVC